jgi:hypothetical protein
VLLEDFACSSAVLIAGAAAAASDLSDTDETAGTASLTAAGRVRARSVCRETFGGSPVAAVVADAADDLSAG